MSVKNKNKKAENINKTEKYRFHTKHIQYGKFHEMKNE